MPEKWVESWESRMRKRANEESGWESVNEAVSYEIEAHALVLHIPNLLKKRKPFEILKLFKEGLTKVALTMQTEESMAEVKHIEGWSWLVYQHPGIVERLGFDLGERNDPNSEALATMSRNKFLTMYGSK